MEFNYDYLIELGFERLDINDGVFERQRGFACFYLIKKLQKGIEANWDCESRLIQIRRFDKKSNIKSRLNIESKEQLKLFLDFFNQDKGAVINPKSKTYDLPRYA